MRPRTTRAAGAAAPAAPAVPAPLVAGNSTHLRANTDSIRFTADCRLERTVLLPHSHYFLITTGFEHNQEVLAHMPGEVPEEGPVGVRDE